MTGIKKKLINSLIYAALLIFAPAQAENSNDFRGEQREFQQFKKDHEAEFEAYKKQLQAAFKQFKSTTSAVWGKNNAPVPDKRTDVNYLGSLEQRNIIDFKSGKVRVEVAVDPAMANNPRAVSKKLKDAIAKTLSQGIDNRSMIDIAKNPAGLKSKGPALLSGQVVDKQGNKVTKINRNTFINTQAKQTKVKKVRGTDNKMRLVVSTEIPLIPDHIRVRAQKYKTSVNKYARQLKIEPEVIFAVMETESFFNPNAKSSVPAFGLMQLVPTSGARDAYRLLFNKDRVVTDRYLYNPDNNIRLGTAFLHKNYFQYFKDIKDPQSRLWATIAAYNTGAGNVFRTFAGKYTKKKHNRRARWKQSALYSINNKTSEQVYKLLRKHLPHKETRNYIKNIRTRIPKYKSI